jgi:translation initiation factor 1A
MTSTKRARRSGSHDNHASEMPLREDGQMYARVIQMVGNGRVQAVCDDGIKRLCKIRGSMRKRQWVRAGDIVLAALRSFQDEKADLVYRYEDSEVNRLRQMGEITALTTTPDDDSCTPDVDALEGIVEFGPGSDEIEWARI